MSTSKSNRPRLNDSELRVVIHHLNLSSSWQLCVFMCIAAVVNWYQNDTVQIPFPARIFVVLYVPGWSFRGC